jgi:branched-chain amino acid transport system ATP-binding protein
VHQLSTYYGTSQVLFDVDLRGWSPRRRGHPRQERRREDHVDEEPSSASSARGVAASSSTGATRHALPTEQRVRWGLGYVPQEHAVFGRLTVRENLVVGAMAARDPSSIDEVVALFPKLGQRCTRPRGR